MIPYEEKQENNSHLWLAAIIGLTDNQREKTDKLAQM